MVGGDRLHVCRADDLLQLNVDEMRSTIRDNDIIYIYHNRIDATGDTLKTENNVFEAVEETINEIINLIRKLTSANANQIFITSDHGFIFQNKDLDESDYLGASLKERKFYILIGVLYWVKD